MIEQAATNLGVPAPDWTRDVPPLDRPVFASELGSLRMHLLRDALLKPAAAVRVAARRVALTARVADDWLNDAVKGYLSDRGDFRNYIDHPNLRVMVAAPEYLLAMKCLAMRLGAEFHDEADIRFLLRLLDLQRYDDALAVITRYHPFGRFPQKTLHALEELLSR